MTGHASGVITVNMAEADDAERERRRMAMHEPYRTLLGHLRHESGHYYWDRLIARTPQWKPSARCSATSGRTTARPWAPTTRRAGRLAGAVRDGICERASVGGLGRDVGALPAHDRHAGDGGGVRGVAQAAAPRAGNAAPRPGIAAAGAVRALIDSWFPLTYVLNNLNRGLGLRTPIRSCSPRRPSTS